MKYFIISMICHCSEKIVIKIWIFSCCSSYRSLTMYEKQQTYYQFPPHSLVLFSFSVKFSLSNCNDLTDPLITILFRMQGSDELWKSYKNNMGMFSFSLWKTELCESKKGNKHRFWKRSNNDVQVVPVIRTTCSLFPQCVRRTKRKSGSIADPRGAQKVRIKNVHTKKRLCKKKVVGVGLGKVCLLSLVSLHVQRQVVRAGKTAVTEAALEGLGPCVLPIMTCQLVGAGEAPLATLPRTLVGLFPWKRLKKIYSN